MWCAMDSPELLATPMDSKCPLQLLGMQDTEPWKSHPKRIVQPLGLAEAGTRAQRSLNVLQIPGRIVAIS